MQCSSSVSLCRIDPVDIGITVSYGPITWKIINVEYPIFGLIYFVEIGNDKFIAFALGVGLKKVSVQLKILQGHSGYRATESTVYDLLAIMFEFCLRLQILKSRARRVLFQNNYPSDLSFVLA